MGAVVRRAILPASRQTTPLARSILQRLPRIISLNTVVGNAPER